MTSDGKISAHCKKISIIGGGNIGTAMLADLSLDPSLSVSMITTNPDQWSRSGIEYEDSVTGERFMSGPYSVTDDWNVLRDSEVILVTVPAFMTEQVVKRIDEHVSGHEIVGFVPGSGGREFYCDRLLKKGCTIFGFDRVPFISRVTRYGHSVSASKKNRVRCAAIPRDRASAISSKIGKLLRMECLPLDNYLTVTFTPSNQILHPSRTYSLFTQYADGTYPTENIPFYREWDIRSSEVLLGCDDELGCICRSLEDIDLSGVIPLREHYESNDKLSLTEKIRSIRSLFSIMSPMKCLEGRFVPDLSSRYFTEDIPFGLCVVKGFATICGVETPAIDEVLDWFQREIGEEYVSNGGLGKDHEKAALPQRFDITNKQDIYKFYLR